MDNQAQALAVLMTAATSEEAGRIAEVLVTKRLAGCVQVLPDMQSMYLWKGEVQRDREALIIAKTVALKFADLEREVRAIHSYETPEIIAVRIDAASEPYLKWLTDCLAGS
jgi:periplasmic divalent cation tolerance protein